MRKLSYPEGTTRGQSLGHLDAEGPAPGCECQPQLSGHAQCWQGAKQQPTEISTQEPVRWGGASWEGSAQEGRLGDPEAAWPHALKLPKPPKQLEKTQELRGVNRSLTESGGRAIGKGTCSWHGKKTTVSFTSENNANKTAAPPASVSHLCGNKTPQGRKGGETIAFHTGRYSCLVLVPLPWRLPVPCPDSPSTVRHLSPGHAPEKARVKRQGLEGLFFLSAPRHRWLLISKFGAQLSVCLPVFSERPCQ